MHTFTHAATGVCAALQPYLPLVALVWATFVFGVGLGVLVKTTNRPGGTAQGTVGGGR